MRILRFYAEWLSYGFLLGILVAGVAIHIAGHRIAMRQYGRRFFIIISVCIIPTLMLPLWFLPLPLPLKIAMTALLVGFGLLKYRAAQRAEETYWQKRHFQETTGSAGRKQP